MLSRELREAFLNYYKNKGHSLIPPAPIVPTDDPTTLFTGSGMQQLVPYLKGETHPMGTRLADSQPCFRAEDIDEIGDNRHTTFFEMLGNWSLGDYFKSEQLVWFWEFLVKEIGLDPDRLHVTLFEGTKEVPKDLDSLKIYESLGVKQDHIHWYGVKKNWWSRAGTPDEMPVGEIGGPTSEVFYEYSSVKHDLTYGKVCHVNCDCGKYIELGNSVFMQYEKTDNGLVPLPAKNVDFGGGLGRILAAAQDSPDVFTTDLFMPIVKKIESSCNYSYNASPVPMRVIADHLRGAVVMLSQNIYPSNKLQGYFLRRLIRRSIVKMRELQIRDTIDVLTSSANSVLDVFDGVLLDKSSVKDFVLEELTKEATKFSKTLDRGMKEIEKAKDSDIDADFVFNLYQSYGFPFEISEEILKTKGIIISKSDLSKKLDSHKSKSRTASQGMFKGGLADHSEEVTRLHTATHLLHQALRDVLGDSVTQAGSNITADRLRFDYTYTKKPSKHDLEKVEDIINEKISLDLPVKKSIMNKEDALGSGALAFFKEKYADKVSVYTIGNTDTNYYSKELCGGPHVTSTGEIGGVRIKKEEALGQGVRRVYAVLT